MTLKKNHKLILTVKNWEIDANEKKKKKKDIIYSIQKIRKS